MVTSNMHNCIEGPYHCTLLPDRSSVSSFLPYSSHAGFNVISVHSSPLSLGPTPCRSDGPSLENLRIMAICGDVQVPLTIESQEGHVGTVSFTPTMAGKGRVWC